jgi:hypothetical protein
VKILLLILALTTIGMLRPGYPRGGARVPQQPVVWRIFYSRPLPRTHPHISISTFFSPRTRQYETLVDNAVLPNEFRIIFDVFSIGYPRALLTHEQAEEWVFLRFVPILPPPPRLLRQRRVRYGEPYIEAPTEQNTDEDEDQSSL